VSHRFATYASGYAKHLAVVCSLGTATPVLKTGLSEFEPDPLDALEAAAAR
jgi:hypothetical protein